MATGNIKKPSKLTKEQVLSASDKKLQRESEAQIKSNNALAYFPNYITDKYCIGTIDKHGKINK